MTLPPGFTGLTFQGHALGGMVISAMIEKVKGLMIS
jgi:hypothetical protein